MLTNPDIGVSPATLYRYIPAARTANTPGLWQRPLYPKDRALQEGFSLAAGGGSAPGAALPANPRVGHSSWIGSLADTPRRRGHAGSSVTVDLTA
jgi:hypothetical protein